jgi:hypothetical protein
VLVATFVTSMQQVQNRAQKHQHERKYTHQVRSMFSPKKECRNGEKAEQCETEA